MNINDLGIKTPYRVTKSKYQFEVEDRIYLQDKNVLVLQNGDEELHKATLVGGSIGFAMTGQSGGFIYLDEHVTPSCFGDDEGNGVDDLPEQFEDGTDMRTFMLKYDETEFEPLNDMVCLSTDYMSTLVKQN